MKNKFDFYLKLRNEPPIAATYVTKSSRVSKVKKYLINKLIEVRRKINPNYYPDIENFDVRKKEKRTSWRQ